MFVSNPKLQKIYFQTLVPSNVTDYVIDKTKNGQTSEVECEIVELIDGPKTEPVVQKLN